MSVYVSQKNTLKKKYRLKKEEEQEKKKGKKNLYNISHL